MQNVNKYKFFQRISFSKFIKRAMALPEKNFRNTLTIEHGLSRPETVYNFEYMSLRCRIMLLNKAMLNKPIG